MQALLQMQGCIWWNLAEGEGLENSWAAAGGAVRCWGRSGGQLACWCGCRALACSQTHVVLLALHPHINPAFTAAIGGCLVLLHSHSQHVLDSCLLLLCSHSLIHACCCRAPPTVDKN